MVIVLTWAAGNKRATLSESTFESEQLARMFVEMLDATDTPALQWKMYKEISSQE